MIRVDQRVVTLTIPPQEVITRDNVPARVNAVVMFQVTDPIKAIMAVENYAVATSQIAQTTLRSLLGRADLDTLLAHREGLNDDLRSIIEKQTESWGVEVRVVEIKDVEIPESMQRAMAREAEAERERRAKVINARGELQASDELRQAAETLSKTLHHFNCGICRHFSSSAPTRTPPSCSRYRSTSSPRSYRDAVSGRASARCSTATPLSAGRTSATDPSQNRFSAKVNPARARWQSECATSNLRRAH